MLAFCRSDHNPHNLLTNAGYCTIFPLYYCVSVTLFFCVVLTLRRVDTTAWQWRTRLHACIKTKGGYFEHSVS